MRVVLATHHLANLAGSETYLITVAEQLERLGHDVVVWAIEQGRSAEIARERGLVVATPDGVGLPQDPDGLLTQDTPTAYALADRYPGIAQLFVNHSVVADLQVPPQLPGVVGATVALSDSNARWAQALAESARSVRLRQPIDLARFTPVGAPRPTPRVALALGNMLRPPRRQALATACEQLGIELREAGSQADVAEHPETEIARADFIVGKGRVIVEAMACGRPAFVYDEFGCAGWVTPERYPEHEQRAFGGRNGPAMPDVAALVEALRGYHADLGLAGRDLALTHHSANDHAVAIVEELTAIGAGTASPPPTPLAEVGRLARLTWRLEGKATENRWMAERMREEMLEREQQRDAALADVEAGRHAGVAHAEAIHRAEREGADRQRRIDEGLARERDLERELDELRRRAHRAEGWITEFQRTGRYRLMRWVFAAVDRLRAR